MKMPKFYLEVYYRSKVHFREYVEIFQDRTKSIQRIPTSESFYNEEIFANIKKNVII